MPTNLRRVEHSPLEVAREIILSYLGEVSKCRREIDLEKDCSSRNGREATLKPDPLNEDPLSLNASHANLSKETVSG